MFWLEVLDVAFLVFHAFIVIFNLVGWVWKKTRKANLLLLLITVGSWVGLGLIYGFGYCPLTDWHWQVLERIDEMPIENSYLQYLLNRLTGIRLKEDIVDFATVAGLCASLIISVVLNIKDYRKHRALRP